MEKTFLQALNFYRGKSALQISPSPELALAELSQPEGARIGKVNKNNIHNQKVSTTFGLPPLVHHMPISGDSRWRLRREGEVELF